MPMIPGRAALRSRRSCVEGSSTAAQRKELLIEESAGTHRRLVDAGIIGWIILGLLAGAIAKLVSGRDHHHPDHWRRGRILVPNDTNLDEDASYAALSTSLPSDGSRPDG